MLGSTPKFLNQWVWMDINNLHFCILSWCWCYCSMDHTWLIIRIDWECFKNNGFLWSILRDSNLVKRVETRNLFLTHFPSRFWLSVKSGIHWHSPILSFQNWKKLRCRKIMWIYQIIQLTRSRKACFPTLPHFFFPSRNHNEISFSPESSQYFYCDIRCFPKSLPYNLLS